MRNAARKSMKHILTVLLLWTSGQCYSRTFDLDTIDNWQVYNGKELVLAGHDSPIETNYEGEIKTNDVTELVIQYNHCIRYVGELPVTIEITDEKGSRIVRKEFNIGSKMVIQRWELGSLTTKSITIRYKENWENGTDRILGSISLV
jgi:hypothetical protein